MPSFSRDDRVFDGLTLFTSTLPAGCRQFGGDKIWACMYDEMLQGSRQLTPAENFEKSIPRVDDMVAPDWSAKYIKQHDLADLQSTHSTFEIETSTVTVRLNVGTNSQGGGNLDWDGRVLP